MSYHVEMTLVLLVLALSVAYAFWRVFKTLRGGNDPCETCELKKNCKKFGKSKEK